MIARPRRPRDEGAGPDPARTCSSGAGAPAPRPARASGDFDLAAWVHGIVGRLDDTPAEPFKQRRFSAPPAEEAAAAPTPAQPAAATRPPPRAERPRFDLTGWVYGLVPQRSEPGVDAPAPSPGAARRSAPAPKRKALTMPDLFDQPATPPCLRDDDEGREGVAAPPTRPGRGRPRA